MPETAQQRIVITVGVHYADGGGGAGRIADDEARLMASLGHEVWVLARAAFPEAPEHELAGGVHLLRYTLPPMDRLDPRRCWQNQAATRRVLTKYVSSAVDLVHGHAPLQYGAACDLYAPRARTCYTVHSPIGRELEITWAQNHGPALRWLGVRGVNHLERRCLVRSQRLTALSQFTKSILQETHGADIAGKVEIIPGWVDLQSFLVIADRSAIKAKLGWPTGIPVLFTLRRLAPRMGLDRLLRAARIVLDGGHDFHLVLGGAGPMRASLEQLARELRLEKRVTFLGYVPDEQLASMYGACDAFVLPTAELECFGLIALEALACGRPVLATPVGAIPEVLNRFEPAWLARAADEASIASLISNFLSSSLPQHDPSALREKVARWYSEQEVLPAFCSYAAAERPALKWNKRSDSAFFLSGP